MQNSPQAQRIYPTATEAIVVLLISFVLLLAYGLFVQGIDAKLSRLLTRVLLVAPMFIFLWYRGLPVVRVLRLHPVSWRISGISALIGLSLTVLGIEIDRLMDYVVPLPTELQALFERQFVLRSMGDWLLLLGGTIALVAVLEELIFRGFLQNAYEEKLDITRAVLVSAFIFSLFHINPKSLVKVVVYGVILGVIAWKSDSIIPAAVIHVMINLVQVLLAVLDAHGTAPLDWYGHVHPLLLLPAGVALYVCIRLYYRYVEEEFEIPTYLNQPL